jgi:Family of unknown function (DUF6152)
MRNKFAAFVAGLIVAAAVPALAHHPFAAQFDWMKPTSMTGTITKVTWASPHTHVYVDARDDQGNVANWDVEMGTPSAMGRYGLTRNALKVGEQIKVDGWLSKDGSKVVSAKSVTLSDGRERFASSSFFNLAQAAKPVATTGTVNKESKN